MAEDIDLSPLVDALRLFWWLWALIAFIGAAKLAWRLYEHRRFARSGIADVDRMDGAAFERFLVTFFRRLGYRVEHTGRRGDYGADLVVAKDGRRTVVQAKRYSKSVGVKAVQEAVAAKGMYDCAAALVVANRRFTYQAQTLARANDVALWDRDVLVEKMLATRGEDVSVTATAVNVASPRISQRAPATPAAPQTPDVQVQDFRTDAHCVVCDVAVSEKVRDYCAAHPARFGRQIYCFKHQRSVRSSAAR